MSSSDSTARRPKAPLSLALPRLGVPNRWIAVGAALLFIGFAGVFWRYATFDWSRNALGAYSHAYLAAPVWIWLMIRAAGRCREHPATTPRVAVLLVASGLLLKLIGNLQGYLVLQGLALIPMLAGLSMAIFGVRGLRRFAFPLAYLLVIVPLPTFLLDELTIPLRLWHAEAAAKSLELLGIGSRAEGFNLFIEPHGAIGFRQLFIGQGCSGIRSLMAFLAIGGPFIHLTLHRGVRRRLLYLSIPLLATSTNFLRIFLTALVAHRWGTATAQSFFHGAAGFLTFLLSLALLIGLAHLPAGSKDRSR